MKRNLLRRIWLSLSLIVLLTGCTGGQESEGGQSAGSGGADDVSADVGHASAPPPAAPEQLYEEILSQYEQALQGEYNAAQLAEAGLNTRCAGRPPSELGYVSLDLNRDNTPELLIGAIEVYGDGGFLDLYTVVDGQAVLLARSSERSSYYLCADGGIEQDGSNSAFNSFFAYYTVDESAALKLEEAIIYDESRSREQPWFYSVSAVSAENADPCSEQDAALIQEKHPRQNVALRTFQAGAAESHG